MTRPWAKAQEGLEGVLVSFRGLDHQVVERRVRRNERRALAEAQQAMVVIEDALRRPVAARRSLRQAEVAAARAPAGDDG
jgi:hypothetical protein